MSLPLRSAVASSLVFAGMQLPWMSSFSWRARSLLCFLAAYLPSYLDSSEYRVAPRRSLVWCRYCRQVWRTLLPFFFNVKEAVIEKPEELQSCEQYILAVHPHGVLSLDHLLTVAGYDVGLEKVAPQARRSALSANVLFKIPFLRELCLWTGCVDAGRKTADKCLERGLSLSVVPGGEREQLLAQRGSSESLVLKERMGFVKLALRHGVPLVPLYCFGEAQLYHQSGFLMQLRSWVQRRLGLALVLPYGPFGIPGLPFRDPLTLVVGAPIKMPRIEKPTEDQVKEHHAKYMAELVALFLRHREPAGYSNVDLKLI